MMGGVSPETGWASYKYGIINILIHDCILLDFLYELYYGTIPLENAILYTLQFAVGGRCQAQYVPDNVHQLHVQQPSTYEKTRGCQ